MTNSNRQVTGLVGVILICGVVGYVCYSLFRIITTFAPDFSVYYGATQELLSGSDPYRSPQLFTGFGYPPFTAVAYLPFLLCLITPKALQLKQIIQFTSFLV